MPDIPNAAFARAVLKATAFLEADVLRISGMKPKALDNLIGRGLMTPSGGLPGRGQRRGYSVDDIVAVTIVQRLQTAGLAVATACGAAEQARSWLKADSQVAHFLTPGMRNLPQALLVTTAGETEIQVPPHGARAGTAAVTLNLTELVQDVHRQLYPLL